MTRVAGDLAGWLAEQGLASEPAGGIADPPRVRALLSAAAREGRVMSYSEMLGLLGHRFTRPKMRALCSTLDTIDRAGASAGKPGLAVLVVRESDGLPGQGWWIGNARRLGFTGAWTGWDAIALVTAEQRAAFAYWASAPVGIVSPSSVAAVSGSPNAT